ncbi:MAG: DUF167 domain-containing protein [Patescibacteria group bacterium]|nr:DUF167 domain-containing protein [Patescibacteria group bacterium]
MPAQQQKILTEKQELYLRVKAIPGAARTEIKTVMADGTIKIAVAAPPEKGKANRALVEFLAEEFGVRKNGVAIISGATNRIKLIKITQGK